MKVSKDLSLSEENGTLHLFSFSRGAAIPIPLNNVDALINYLQAAQHRLAADGLVCCPNCHYILNFQDCPKCGEAIIPAAKA